MKPFLKETKTNSLFCRMSGPVQIVAQCSDRSEGPVRLEGPIQSRGQGWYNHWGHAVRTLFGQLVLGKQAGRWVQGHLRPVRLVSDVSTLPSMNLTSAFARTQGKEKNCLEGQMLQGGLPNWFKGSLCELVQNQRKVPGGDTPSALGSVSVETVQESGEIFIFADVEGRISQFISNGRPVAINGAGLQFPLLKKVHKEISN